jgi:hypothetical protein
MAQAGEVIESPMTGERITFLHTARDTDGAPLLDDVQHPGAKGPAMHLHMRPEERLIVHGETVRAESNGQPEGQITELKLVKRAMCGRGKFGLLRQRVLHAA